MPQPWQLQIDVVTFRIVFVIVGSTALLVIVFVVILVIDIIVTIIVIAIDVYL